MFIPGSYIRYIKEISLLVFYWCHLVTREVCQSGVSFPFDTVAAQNLALIS